MKVVIVPVALALAWTVLVVLVSQHLAPPRPASAETLINAAVRVAQTENKGVLIHFGATWCKWCKRLDAAFESPELSNIIIQKPLASVRQQSGTVASSCGLLGVWNPAPPA